MGERGEKVQTSSYKINQPWECNVQHGDCSQQQCVVYLKVAKKVNLESSHHKKKNLTV